LEVKLDPRATYTVDDRKLQLAASMRAYALLEDLAFDVDRINAARDTLQNRPGCADLAKKADDIRKEIVATKEGGDITGEERIREKTSQLYGALVFYEGKPADYYVTRIDSLTHERMDVVAEFDKFVQTANTFLISKKLAPLQPITREAWEKSSAASENGGGGGGKAWLSAILAHAK
jgi:hypothetical protein